MLDQSLIAHISDLKNRCDTRNIMTRSEFLTPSEAAQIKQEFHNDASMFFFGGYNGAERVMLFFLPEYLTSETVHEYITPVRCVAPFSSLTHRDYLGSILSLGIKRSCIGDILVSDEEATILLDSKIAEYVTENLTRIGRGGVSCKMIELSEVIPPIQKYREITATVASLRADAVFAAAFGVSREKTAALIKEESCTVNWLAFNSPSAQISEGDILSARGLGRAKLFSVGGNSKKNRTFITIHQYE